MGNFLDDVKKRNEERRIARIRQEIRGLEAEVREYENAKSKVQDAKDSCSKESGEWQETVGQLVKKEIKQTGVFEGEMASKLETYVNEAKKENDDAIQKASDLISSLGTQISKIDDRIDLLNSRIDYKRSLI